MPSAHLSDRGTLKITGEDATGFLQNLVTADVAGLAPGRARLSALLTPQGKILFDFLVVRATEDIGGGFWLDVGRAVAPDLARRLGFYKLRAKVAVEDLSDTIAVVAGWGDTAPAADEFGLVYPDPRLPELGWRAFVASSDAPGFGEDAGAYHAHRTTLGVPEGGKDYAFGEAFPHEADMDQLGGVDFAKGCYVGQEVVSRMEHRGTARTRIVQAVFPGGIAAPEGSEIVAGDRTIGRLGSAGGGRAIATVRLDRAADAMAAGIPLTAGAMELQVMVPAWARFRMPETAGPA